MRHPRFTRPRSTASLLALLGLLGLLAMAGPFAMLAKDRKRTPIPPELGQLFPIGREFRGVTIPSYSETRLQSVMNADVIVRIDETYLDLTNLTILLYNSQAEPETTISMDKALYHLGDGELISQTPARIEQPRFTMTGTTMVYDTATQTARLVGDVRVVLPDAKAVAPAMPFGLPGR